jgi:hypothetical protein
MVHVFETKTHVRSWALISSIQIRMHDDTISILSELRHILGRARNPITLSTLDVKEYKRSGHVQFLRHVIGDMNCAELYVLRGIIILTGTVVAAITPNEPCQTNLRHMHLGHMSGHSMVEFP